MLSEGESMLELLKDISYAARTLRKSPVFTGVAILSLALAIGANTAIFSLLDALSLRDLPVRNASELTQLSLLMRSGQQAGLSLQAFQAVEAHAPTLSSLVAWSDPLVAVDVAGTLSQEAVSTVTGNFHTELGVTPLLGRLLTPNDVDLDTYAPSAVAVVGYGFWRRRLGADPHVVGRVIRIEDVPFTIIGVTSPGFRGLLRTTETAVTLPLTANSLLQRQTGKPPGSVLWLNVVGRRKPGITLAQARAQLTADWPQVLNAAIPPEVSGARRANFLAFRLVVDDVVPAAERLFVRRFVRPLYILLAIALLVVVIGCVNLAALMLARTVSRRNELGLRLALGASRWQVARLTLLEAALVSLAGGVCGLVIAPWLAELIARTILSTTGPRSSLQVGIDSRVVLFTCGVTIGACLMCSAIPAWRAGRRDPLLLLSRRGRTVSGVGRVGELLVGTQIALCTVLAVNAALLVRTLQALYRVAPGFVTDDVVTATLQPRPGSAPAWDEFYPRTLIDAARTLPGNERAALTLRPIAAGPLPVELVSPTRTPDQEMAAAYNAVSPGFFELLSVRLVAGRDFTWDDRERTQRVVIITRGLARRLFGDADPLFQTIRIGVLPGRQDLTIVGVAEDARLYDIKDTASYAVYMPVLQEPQASFGFWLLMRGIGGSFDAASRMVASLGHQYVSVVESLGDVRARALAQERVTALLAVFFGGLTFLLGGIGTSGLTSYDTRARRRELAIRLALGAQPARVISGIVARRGKVASLAAGVGVAASLLTTQLVRSLLFGTTSRDPGTLAIVPLMLLAITAVSAAVPAAKAAREDLIAELRPE